MFLVPVIGWSVAAGGITLTQKGYGHVGTDSGDTDSLALSYANVDGGSAPSAGDLVLWEIVTEDSSASPLQDLTGSGWEQSELNSSVYYNAAMAKVVAAGDISSPPTIVVGPTFGALGMWVAYEVSGTISSLTIGGHLYQFTASSAPANKSLSLSALEGVMIAVSIGTGTDGTVLPSWSGAAADGTNEQDGLSAGGSIDATIMWKLYADGVSGEDITVSKGDDGLRNGLGVFYVTVS